MSRGKIYIPRPAGDWVVTDLDQFTVRVIQELPFPLPPAPIEPEVRKRTYHTSAEEIVEEQRTIGGLKALRGKITDEDYKMVWDNFNQLRENRAETGEGD